MYKVTKKFLSLLLALILCLSTSQLTQAAEPPIPETPGTTDIGQPAPPINDGEPHGLILMTQNNRRAAMPGILHQNTILQIYTISPDNGEQNLWSQFTTSNPSVSIGYPSAGGLNQFTHNYTKLAATLRDAEINECNNYADHAGWIDQSGNFFDVSAALGIANNSTIGFYGSDFYFTGVQTMVTPAGKHYVRGMICKATESEIRQGRFNIVSTGSEFDIVEPYIRYIVSKDILGGVRVTGKWGALDGQTMQAWGELPVTSYAEPSKNIFIVDYLPKHYQYLPIKHYTSLMCDSVSGTLIHYLPDSYNTDNKSEWGGVLSPDGTTVAYLTVPGTSGQVSLEYTDISGFFASGFNPASRGVPTKMELADGPVKQATWNVYDYVTENPSCILLEWRE